MTKRVSHSNPSEAERWIRAQDGGLRIILAELTESAGKVNVLWSSAIDRLSADPEQALARLIDLEIRLEHFVRPELEDALKSVQAAIERLAAERPDGGDEADSESGEERLIGS